MPFTDLPARDRESGMSAIAVDFAAIPRQTP
jgi:hypothetical protein